MIDDSPYVLVFPPQELVLRYQRGLRHTYSPSSDFGFVSPPIGEALSPDALERLVRALNVIHAKLDAVGVAKIEFARVAMKVLVPAMLVRADHPALEDGEEAFNRVRVDIAVFEAHIFARLVIDGIM